MPTCYAMQYIMLQQWLGRVWDHSQYSYLYTASLSWNNSACGADLHKRERVLAEVVFDDRNQSAVGISEF